MSLMRRVPPHQPLTSQCRTGSHSEQEIFMHDPLGCPESELDDSLRLDIDFSVPMVHRLRFTRDCFGSDLSTVGELFAAGEESRARARVQVWLDEGLEDAEIARTGQGLSHRLVKAFNSLPGLEMTSLPECLPGGEQVKNDPAWIERLLSAFHRDNLDRRSYVVAVGGGAVLDAVGYAAAIAHRGIRLIRFPTTTLAQADSGVGVKNAVNWFGKKNWKGTFAAPWGVVNDQALLEGLSDRDFRCGFAEGVKVALLKSADFFEFLSAQASRIAQRESVAAQRAIRTSVLLHLQHITRGGDPFEMEQARPLDFGHWSAHKLEAITDYGLRHGEAVSIGVAVDTAYSHLCLGLPQLAVERSFQILSDLQLPLWHAALHEEVLFDGLEEFRQHLGGELTVTLLEDVGRPVNVHNIDRGAMREAIAMVVGWSSVINNE